jgi:hypothetical protein
LAPPNRTDDISAAFKKCIVVDKTTYSEKQDRPVETLVQEESTGSNNKNYEWILNEDLLRDEAILFGLSGSDYQGKVDTIRKFYQHKIAIVETDLKALGDEREKRESTIRSTKEHISSLKSNIESWSTQPKIADHTFYRSLARFSIYSLTLIFTYFIVIEWMGSRWENSILVSLGVFLFGSLSLFSDFSILYSSDKQKADRAKWKTILEEFSIPFITTLFIVFWGDKNASTLEAVILALLIFALFLFVGKGWLSSIEQLRANYLILKKNFSTNRFTKEKIQKAIAEIKKLEEFIEEEKKHIIDLSESINVNTQEIQSLKSEIEVKISYFLSEFSLAKATRENTSSEQLFRWGLNPKRDTHG